MEVVGVSELEMVVGHGDGHGRLDSLNWEVAGEVGAGGEFVDPASNVVESVRCVNVRIHGVRIGSSDACMSRERANGAEASQKGGCAPNVAGYKSSEPLEVCIHPFAPAVQEGAGAAD